MPRKAIVTVGLGFGDEGKGATVDYLTRIHKADLVVKYCGGCQCGHNVVLPDGRSHVFSQFGSGTFAGARTYIGPNVIFDPFAFQREAKALDPHMLNPRELVSIHPNCLISTPYLKMMNRIRSRINKHGTCGMGVGETRGYWLRFGKDSLRAKDLMSPWVSEQKLELMRQRCLQDLQKYEVIPEDYEVFNQSPATIARQMSLALGPATIRRKCEFNFAVFEGAQGVLLDEWYGFHPHTTWSTVTQRHALELLDDSIFTVIGITRTYHTRHGTGPLPTYSELLTSRLEDPGNPTNQYQGTIRCGWLDTVLLKYAIDIVKPDSLAVNHFDQIDDDFNYGTFCYKLEVPKVPTLRDQKYKNDALRHREAYDKPNVGPITSDQLLHRLNDLVPVSIQGWGRDHLNRQGGQDLVFKPLLTH